MDYIPQFFSFLHPNRFHLLLCIISADIALDTGFSSSDIVLLLDKCRGLHLHHYPFDCISIALASVILERKNSKCIVTTTKITNAKTMNILLKGEFFIFVY